MRSDRVVVLAPLLEDDGSLLQTEEYFAVQAFIAQFPVEGLAVAILPWAAGSYVERLRSQLCKPAAHNLCRHLRAVVRTHVFRHTALDHHVGHGLDNAKAKAVDATGHPDRQAFPRELVDQSHQPEFAPIVGLRFHKIVAPNMIAMLRSQPDAGSVVEPQPAARSLLPGYLQPLTAPDSLNSITTHLPACVDQQRCDPAIAISSVLRC